MDRTCLKLSPPSLGHETKLSPHLPKLQFHLYNKNNNTQSTEYHQDSIKQWLSTAKHSALHKNICPQKMAHVTMCYSLSKVRQLSQSAVGFPHGSGGKESACQEGHLGLIPGLGRSPAEGNGNPLQYSCLGNPMDRGAWWVTVHGISES